MWGRKKEKIKIDSRKIIENTPKVFLGSKERSMFSKLTLDQETASRIIQATIEWKKRAQVK